MIQEILTILALIWIYIDIVYPYVQYPLMAHKYKAGMPYILPSRPLGIPITANLFRALRKESLLKTIFNRHVALPAKTLLQQSTFKWVIFTRDPENIKAVLATKFKDFNLTERTGNLAPIFGSGIFTQDGEQWKHSRAMLRPQFSKEQVSRLEHISFYVKNMVKVIDDNSGTVDILRVFHMLTMDTATEFLFGESVDSLNFSSTGKGSYVTTEDGKRIYASDFVESYTFLNDFALKKIMLNAAHWILNYIKPEYKMHLERTRAFIDHYVRQALEHTADKEAVEAEEDDEKSKNYVFSYELAKETRDPVVLRDQLLNILIAGRDTTASTFSFCFYYFALYPDTWQKCRKEVFEAFNEEGENADITYEKLKSLKYVSYFIKEILRLHPVVPFNSRTAARDTLLPRGGGSDQSKPVLVPKGSSLNYSVYVMQRDKSIYGPDAEEFRPERWDPANKIEDSPMYGWGYLPFNGGPRICLGQQFALTELTLTIAKLALEFKSVEKAEGFPIPLTERNSLTLLIGGKSVPIRFVR